MDDIVTVELHSTKVEMVKKTIEVPQFIIKENMDAKLELMERERQELRKIIREEFRKRIEDLEANILAYEDLLITKEEDIRLHMLQLAKMMTPDMSEQAKETIIQFKLTVEKLLAELISMKNPHSNASCPMEYNNKHRKGHCGEA
jgi:hypothetical protein